MQLKLSFRVHYHIFFLLIEKLPHLCNCLQVVLGHFVKMSFARGQLLFVLFLHHFKVEAEESFYFWGIRQLQSRERKVQLVKRLQQPLVQLRPLSREVILYENRNDQS